MSDKGILITVQDLRKSYISTNRQVDVLNGINLEIKESEMMAIMGPSGVGKSTLLHILGALDTPTSGKVYYRDKDIFALKNSNLIANFRNKTIGFVFQFHHLLPEFTAEENVMIPCLIAGQSRRQAKERAQGLLKDVGLSDRLIHKPGELSGGQQQRVAIARSLVLEPSAVMADEPTGNLDTHTGAEIFALLKSLNKKIGITFLIATHNDELASQCTRIIRMLDGKLMV
jgi:lipoprotein-releasing system ATP-binding protein